MTKASEYNIQTRNSNQACRPSEEPGDRPSISDTNTYVSMTSTHVGIPSSEINLFLNPNGDLLCTFDFRILLERLIFLLLFR